MDILGWAIVVAIVVLVVVAAVRIVTRARSHSPYDAAGRRTVPIGAVGPVRTELAPTGVVYVAGEDWTARSGSGARLAAGVDVRVVGQQGLTLIVEPIDSTSPSA